MGESGEAARAPAAWFPPAGVAPPTFQILPRVPKGARGRCLCSKVGKGKGGRIGREGGMWLSKVLNLESKLGVGEQSSLRHTDHPSSACLTSLRQRRAKIWGRMTLIQARCC